MPKNSAKQIKNDEQDVIKQLIQDSRQSPHEIAKKLGFSRQKVWRIIKKLEKEKKIWGYTTVIDEEVTNTNIYFALGKATLPDGKIIEKLIVNTKNENSSKYNIRVLYVFYLNGYYDWICIYSAENIREAKKYLNYIQREYSPMIENMILLENL